MVGKCILCVFSGVLDPCLRFEASKPFINFFDNKSSILSLICALYNVVGGNGVYFKLKI